MTKATTNGEAGAINEHGGHHGFLSPGADQLNRHGPAAKARRLCRPSCSTGSARSPGPEKPPDPALSNSLQAFDDDLVARREAADDGGDGGRRLPSLTRRCSALSPAPTART